MHLELVHGKKIVSNSKDLTLYERNSDKLSSWDIPQKLKSAHKGIVRQLWIYNIFFMSQQKNPFLLILSFLITLKIVINYKISLSCSPFVIFSL